MYTRGDTDLQGGTFFVQFYYIRHAQSENNLLWTRTGASVGRSADPDITDAGRRQAHLLAQYLCRTDTSVEAQERDLQNVGGFGLTHLYSSLMIRAVATGTIVARELGLPLVAWQETHEWGGLYLRDEETDERIGLPGPNRAYFEAHYPDLVLPDSLGEAGWWNRPFEEREERTTRARRFLQELLERHDHTEDRVALISHGGFYNHVLEALLDLPDRERFWFTMHNGAISRIDFGDPDPDDVERIGLIYTNRVEHLPAELIT